MPRYIDADAFRRMLIKRQITTRYFNSAERNEIGCIIDMLDNTPPADVKPRITAEWILNSNGVDGTCTGCYKTQKNICDDDSYQNYCGCCGAMMTGIDE